MEYLAIHNSYYRLKCQEIMPPTSPIYYTKMHDNSNSCQLKIIVNKVGCFLIGVKHSAQTTSEWAHYEP